MVNKIVKTLVTITILLFTIIFLFWNFFPTTKLIKKENGEKIFEGPGIYISQKNTNKGADGSIKVDYARMNVYSYKKLVEIAEKEGDSEDKNYFLQAVNDIKENSKDFSDVEEMLKTEHKNFILF